jgi:hypothetical protein
MLESHWKYCCHTTAILIATTAAFLLTLAILAGVLVLLLVVRVRAPILVAEPTEHLSYDCSCYHATTTSSSNSNSKTTTSTSNTMSPTSSALYMPLTVPAPVPILYPIGYHFYLLPDLDLRYHITPPYYSSLPSQHSSLITHHGSGFSSGDPLLMIANCHCGCTENNRLQP